MKTIEMRQDERVSTLVRVDYRTPETSNSDFAEDLSAGGAFIATPNPLPQGTLLTVEFLFPEYQEPLRLKAIVAWSRHIPAGPKRRRGMGIRFERLSAGDQKRIDDIVARLAARP